MTEHTELPPSRPINQIRSAHPDEFVVIKITGFDGRGIPTEGYLIAADPNDSLCVAKADEAGVRIPYYFGHGLRQ